MDYPFLFQDFICILLISCTSGWQRPYEQLRQTKSMATHVTKSRPKKVAPKVVPVKLEVEPWRYRATPDDVTDVHVILIIHVFIYFVHKFCKQINFSITCVMLCSPWTTTWINIKQLTSIPWNYVRIIILSVLCSAMWIFIAVVSKMK